MKKNGAECTRFHATSQFLANKARMILKKDWFSKLEIYPLVNREVYQQDTTKRAETLNTKSKKPLTELKHKIRKN